ncbi:MAG: MFS transporter [Rhodospirillaceae bacterium]|nr:MFS transporter [Rhodospirillaceae bacterium]
MSGVDNVDLIDSPYAWRRLAVALALCTIGGIGFWSVVVALPAIEAEFGVDRGSASLPYFATLSGFAAGGILMGRLADRYGIVLPVILGAVMLGLGYIAAAQATSLWQFMLAQGVLIGFLGASATFAPMVADISHWFVKRRGIAVAIVASGNYLSGALWPPALQYTIDQVGWRDAHTAIGIICIVTMIPLALTLRRRPPIDHADAPGTVGSQVKSANMSPRTLQVLLIVAGVACCVAMSMPQVHMVAYCGDLGYGAQRGAEILSVMLGLGIASRLISGVLADRIGALPTILVGSALQGLALLLYLPYDGLVSLYVVSGIFGLAQGGIVPTYALIVREFFPAREAATRVSLVFTATILGMALGGWVSGEIFDLTGSYRAAFLNGTAWNLLNLMICMLLLVRYRRAQAAMG